jgi:hypothetical protein
MLAVKVNCGCGQHYSFDVEPVEGRMPVAVTCPRCGVDGTAAANSVIAQYTPAAAPAPTVPATPAFKLRAVVPTSPSPAASASALATPAASPFPAATAPRGTMVHGGQTSHAQALFDAKAKISWGDPPEVVSRFLMTQGFSYQDANDAVAEMWKERAAEIRKNGMKKIFMGCGLLCVPVVGVIMFLTGFLPIKLFAVTIMVGVYGLWVIMKGVFMVIAPKSEAGDVAEQ